jgi:pimeloyl-ACP methyl ester carboxylesterase
VPEAAEPRRDRRAHPADADDADFHSVNTTLVSISTDTVALEGAWYEPAGDRAANAALLFHGNTMNFYSGPPRFLPPALSRLGYAALAFNRRGHDILTTRDSRAAEGAAFQTISEAIADNRFAADWLGSRGFARPVVIGHSNGGMLAVRHVADHPRTPALVLLSAHCGGSKMVSLASKAGLLAQDRLEELATQAEQWVRAGRGRELMLLPGWWYVTSAASFLDLANCPDILELAPQIRCPVLYLRGDREPPDLYPAEEFQRRCQGHCTVEIVPQCDHFYVGRESVVSAIVSRWLGQTLQGGQQ